MVNKSNKPNNITPKTKT